MSRLTAHQRLTDAARALRSERPGMSLADAMELATLREPELAGCLQESLAARDEAGPVSQYANSGDVPGLVKAFVRSPNGKTDVARVRALGRANRCWSERYETLNAGAQVIAVLMRLQRRHAEGQELVFP